MLRLISLLVFSAGLMFTLSLSGDAAPDVPAPPPAPRSVELRGIWIHTYNPYDWDTVMKRVAAAGFNSVFVRVARGVNAIYPSQFLPRDTWAQQNGGDELQKAITAAHRNGLRFHAWKACFNCSAAMKVGGAPAAMYQEMSRQDRLSRDPAGKQTAFLNPGDPRNTDLEFNVLTELASKYDVDGIHLDYIRYTEVPDYDFDYGAVSRGEFEKALGRPVAHWPDDVYAGDLKVRYEDWERGNINHLVERLHTALKESKPGLKLSAAVWRDHRWVRSSIKQDWPLWVRRHWLDFVVPMDYTKEDADFRETVRAQVPNTMYHVPLITGIGSFFLKDPDAVLRQIQIAREQGADGYVLFDYKPEMQPLLEALAAGPQSMPAEPADVSPHLEWLLSPGVPRQDDVPAYATGSLLSVNTPGAAAGTVLMLRPQAASTGSIRIAPGQHLQLPATEGRWRLEALLPAGERIPLRHVRGPLLETLAPARIAELQSHDVPPHPGLQGLKVAVYSGGWAASGVMKCLATVAALQPYLIHHLQPSYWKSCDVLVLPQLNDVSELTESNIQELRDWVRQGGRLLLTHDAVGYRWHPRLFPEIARGIAGAKEHRLEVLPGMAGVTAGITEHSYPNHVLLQPAEGATVVAREAAGAGSGGAVIVTARFGKGRVTMDGALPGYKPDAMTAEEKQLLIEMLELPLMKPLRLVVMLVLGLLLAARAAPVAAPRALPPPTEKKLRELLARPALQQAHVGLAIVALGTAKAPDAFPAQPYAGGVQPLLLGIDSNKRFLPASNLKLFTAALALHVLGPRHVFTTRLFMSHDGLSLKLVGGGDPSLTSADLIALARQLGKPVKPSVFSLTYSGGGLTAETFDGRYPDGWTLDDSIWYYGPEITGLAVDRNQVDVIVTGASRPGLPAQVELDPQMPEFQVGRQVLTQVITGNPGLARFSADDLLHFDRVGPRLAPDDKLVITGHVAPGLRLVTGVALPHPDAVAARQLALALRGRGILVGTPRPFVPSADGGEVEVAHHDSAPLQFLLRRLLKNSDNLYAEMFLRDAALAAGTGPAANQAEAGRDLILLWLQQNNVITAGLQIRDGSGLGRYNLATPLALAQLLRLINDMPHGDAIWEALPVAGQDGTLAHRMQNTAAARNVRAKTGTFSIASTLSGYVTTRDGHRLAVSLLTNFAPDGDAARHIQDLVFETLAASNLKP